MSEAKSITGGLNEREKSYTQIINQRNRILNRLASVPYSQLDRTRIDRVNRTAANYIRNIEGTDFWRDTFQDYLNQERLVKRMGNEPVGSNPAQSMAEYREAQADRDALRYALENYPFTQSEYMRRRNNRRR